MTTTRLALFSALSATALAAPASAQTLYWNMNGVRASASGEIVRFAAILVDDAGKVVHTYAPAVPLPAAATRIDMGGRTVLPGLLDAHGHVMGLGQALLSLDLTGTTSLAELQSRLRDHAAANPDAKWIVGRGWNQENWPTRAFPTAADLDAVISDRPVLLERVDGHAIVVNSKAMAIAGVTPATRAPAGGVIDKGLFVDAAQALITKAVPEPGDADLDRALSASQRAMLSVGLVGAADMGTTKRDWHAMRRAGEAATLKVRITSYAAGPEGWAAIHDGKPVDWLYGDRLALVGTKLYADGALGSRGAYLKAPYSDAPKTRGLRFHTPSALLAMAVDTAEDGGQLAIHAIGDGANEQVISVLEKISARFGPGRRSRIEHFQIADPADIPRLRAAGLIASMQPTHETSDWKMAEARLGKDRLGGAYAWRTVEKLGIPLAFGSDFPVESPNPFPGLAAAISREDSDGKPVGGWLPAQKLTLGEALAAFTIGAAYAGKAEARMGGLEAGRWADFIIVDTDPTTASAQAIRATRVLETWIGGEKVFSAS